LALALAVTACGGDDDDDPGTDGATEEGALEEAPGFDGTTIRVGALTNTGPPLAAIGGPLTEGNKAYIAHVNSEGGIAGKYPIELVQEDTGYSRDNAPGKFTDTVDDVVMYMQVLGTPIVDVLLPSLEDENVIGAPASLDSDWVRDPQLLPVGAPYQIQAINGIDWYYSQAENEGDVLCALASDDEYGDAGLQGVEAIAAELDIDVAEVQRFAAPGGRAATPDFGPIVSSLEGASCGMVFLTATLADFQGIATAFGDRLAAGFSPTVIGQSPNWATGFAAIPWVQSNFLLVAEGTEYGDTSVEGMAELVSIKDEFAAAQQPDIYFNFGYLQAIATVALLEKAVELGDLSRDGMATALDELGTVSFGGLSGDYTYGPPEDRVPPVKNTIFKPAADKPTGLGLVERDYEAESAKDFPIE
jgi:ABC-type branched-subunit amino acid transport system substrate-binding protein